MDDAGVADAFYTVLSIGIVLVAAIAVAGVVLSTTAKQGGEAAAQIAGYGDGGLKKGLYCFYFEVDGAGSNFSAGDPDAIAPRALSLETTADTIALNASSAPANAPLSSGLALWSGYLYVPETRSYTLERESSGPAWLWVDGTIVASHSKTFTLDLTKGNHPLKMKYYYPDIRAASCSLSWKQDGVFVPVRSFNR